MKDEKQKGHRQKDRKGGNEIRGDATGEKTERGGAVGGAEKKEDPGEEVRRPRE